MPSTAEHCSHINPDLARPRDVLRTPERFDALFGLLVISGKPGAGTSSLAKGLADRTGARLYKAGDTVRELTRTQERIPDGFIDRDAQIDEIVDSTVRKMVVNARVGDPAIAEAQIGAATALQTQNEVETSGYTYIDAPIVRILIWARKVERERRLQQAARAEGKNVSLRTAGQNTSSREKGDLEHWRNLYSFIGTDDPLEKGALDANGQRIFDIEIDNSDITAEQTLEELIVRLRRMGYLKPRLEPGAQQIINPIQDQ